MVDWSPIPNQLDPDFSNVLSLAHKTGMYAYDAYFLDCALRYGAPLLTLDKKLRATAISVGVKILEV